MFGHCCNFKNIINSAIIIITFEMHGTGEFNYSVTRISEDHIIQSDESEQSELLSINIFSCYTSDQCKPTELYPLRMIIIARDIHNFIHASHCIRTRTPQRDISCHYRCTYIVDFNSKRFFNVLQTMQLIRIVLPIIYYIIYIYFSYYLSLSENVVEHKIKC